MKDCKTCKVNVAKNYAEKIINYKEFADLVKRMREAQNDVIYKSMFFALDSARPTAYEVAKTKQLVLEQEVDEHLKNMENENI